MKTLTIYDIEKLTKETEPYFFNQDTLNAFGQTMEDFKVTELLEKINNECVRSLEKVTKNNVGKTWKQAFKMSSFGRTFF